MTEEKKRRIAFISSPLSGDIEANIEFAQKACLYAICLGYTPLAPHLLYPGIIPDSDPGWRNLGIGMGLDLLALCDEAWICGPEISSGMQTELDRAKDLGLWVRRVSREEVEQGIEVMENAALEARLKELQP